MATNVLLPQWGMNMEEGLLVRWLVKEGDTVQAGQPLVDVETAKINSALEAPASGVVAHILVPEGTTVKVGTLVAVIAEPGELVPRPTAQAAPAAGARPAAPAAGPAQARERVQAVQVTPVARKLAREHNIDLAAVQGTGPGGRIMEDDVRRAIEAQRQPAARAPVQVVPAARLLAKQRGIDLATVQGTGPNGRILVADVERAIARAAAPSPRGPEGEVVPLRGLRRTIAERMLRSTQTMAQVTLTTEADVTDMVRLREALVSHWRAQRIRPLDMDLIVAATASALREHPRLNSWLTDEGLRLVKEINIGTATAVPDGLMVPVIKRADEKDLLSIAREVRELARKARDGRLTVDDVTGATFTITSLASQEIDAFTPLVDPPQVAILGVGRVVEKPAVYQGEIAIRSLMALSLTFDHRALDGVPAGEFLRAVKRKLESPAWLAPGLPA